MSGLWQCTFCLYRFEDKQSLLDHEDDCLGDTSRPCNWCGQVFDTEEEAEEHEDWCDQRDENDDA